MYRYFLIIISCGHCGRERSSVSNCVTNMHALCIYVDTVSLYVSNSMGLGSITVFDDVIAVGGGGDGGKEEGTKDQGMCSIGVVAAQWPNAYFWHAIYIIERRLTGTKRASVRGLEDQRRPHQESKTTDALRPSDLLLFIDFQQPQQLGQAHALTGIKL
ncbi:uncharacterized protein BO87DRAFT_385767 [Aspergillus neoniger CBS 115656]|uniref:Uncharacterized protein n=1 Tax=Aspergillus neoniger (strain CBS 115656) TaxID=1448310 RepID=A0A318YLN9_ASPNB|nr:hypothetical protein BO87DRAFT_385767 [Aspergillus neoniger CBS 115656]PYH35515.1 hypothetical protein BO87DRAFT_385767 [Aspergillus neoniger CBS 115656]